MKPIDFETHIVEEQKQPFIRYLLSMRPGNPPKLLNANWHSNIEILYCVNGSGEVLYNTQPVEMHEGDIIVINSNIFHDILRNSTCDFYVFIIDDAFCYENAIDPEKIVFEECIRDPIATESIEAINAIFDDTDNILKIPELRHAILGFLIYLCKHHVKSETFATANSSKIEKIKTIITYLKSHFTEKLTLDQIAEDNHVSKSYLVHEFKRYTGQTILEYIHTLRCINAQSLIRNGMNVSTAAISSGFENLSYFARIYKKIMTTLPSQEKI